MARVGRPAYRNNTMSEDEFFAGLSKKSNYIPENTVRDVYFGLINLIREEMRKGNGLDLPALGGLSIVRHQANIDPLKRINNPSRNYMGNQMYFKASVSMKNYLKSLEIE